MPEILDAFNDREFRRLLAQLSPSAFVFAGDDHLRVRSFGSLAGVELRLEGRFVTSEGEIVPLSERHPPASDRTEVTSLHSMGPGVLLGASIRASSGTPRRGQVFAIVDVVRGHTGAIQPLACLLQGYVSAAERLAWPGSPIDSSAEGPGVLRSVTGTNPAANVEISETVPTNARWRPLAISYELVTAVAAANRESALVIDDGAILLARVPSGFTHVASTTIRYSAFHHAPRFTLAQDTAKNFPLPRVDLAEGMRLRTITTNLQAADDYGAPQILVEEWIED